jgi:hypothetical protein
MSRSVAEITQEALQLPHHDQFRLVRTLLENVELQRDPGVDAAWEDEIERRIAVINKGIAKGYPFAEVLRDVDELLKQQ